MTLPQRDHVSSPYVRASSMGLCPLQGAYEKLSVAPDLPRIKENEDTHWLMDHGSYVAEMVQESLMYYAMVHTGFAFEPEHPFIDDTLQVAGRLDGILDVAEFRDGLYSSESCVIEIKDTEGKKARSVGEPTLRYAYQTLLYMLVTGIKQGAIVTVSKWTWTVWDLVPVGKGFVIMRNGEPYHSVVKNWVNWNTPEQLNFHEVKKELARQHNYLYQVNLMQRALKEDPTFDVKPKAPFDPFNDDMSWLCTWQDKPTSRTPEGTAQPNCAWCKSCHGLEDRTYKTERVGDRIQLK